MNRGSTPYALRGTSLVLPNGTLQNPSVRFGRERSGLYRSSDGRMSLGLKQFRAAEFSADGLAVFSDSPGNAHVTPLSVFRDNPTTADGQETALDTYETGVLIARAAVFRESATKSGFKWYGFSSGLHATPAMALSGDKDLAVGRDLLVARNLLVNGTTRLVGNVTLDGTITGNATLTTLTTTGLATLNSLSVTNNATLKTLTTTDLATLHSLVVVNGTTLPTLTTTGLATLNSLQVVNNTTVGGTVLINGTTLTLRPTTGAAGVSLAPVQNGQHSQVTLSNNGDAQALVLGLQATTSGYLSNQVGDGNIYTNGGRLLLGAFSQARVVMDSGQTRFFGDGLDLAGLITTGGLQGRWRLGVPEITPATRLHIQSVYPGDGITIANSTSQAHAVTLTNNAQGDRQRSSHLYLFHCAGGGYLGAPTEGGLYTSGSKTPRAAAGRAGRGQETAQSQQHHLRSRGDRVRMDGQRRLLGLSRPSRSAPSMSCRPSPATGLPSRAVWSDPVLQLSNSYDLPSADAHGYFCLANANGQFIGGSLGSMSSCSRGDPTRAAAARLAAASTG